MAGMICMQAGGLAPRRAAETQGSNGHRQPHQPDAEADEHCGQQEGKCTLAARTNTCQQATVLQSASVEPAGPAGQASGRDDAAGARSATVECNWPCPAAAQQQRPPLSSTQPPGTATYQRAHSTAQVQAAQGGKRRAHSGSSLEAQTEKAEAKRAKLAFPTVQAQSQAEGRSSDAGATAASQGSTEVIQACSGAGSAAVAAAALGLQVAPLDTPVLRAMQLTVFPYDNGDLQHEMPLAAAAVGQNPRQTPANLCG